MSNPIPSPVDALPLTGNFTAEKWASFFGIEKKTLLENLSKYQIRVIRFGRAVVINAEWFWADLMNEEDKS